MDSIPDHSTLRSEHSGFKPGIRVAVIGAGASGICAAAHLLKQGANVTVFERSTVSSGVWHFDPRVDKESVAYPSKPPSVGDYTKSSPGQFLPSGVKERRVQKHPLEASDRQDLEAAFAPPGPCYHELKNNIPTSLLYSSLQKWPAGTEPNSWRRKSHALQYASRGRNKDWRQMGWALRTITLLDSDGHPNVVERLWQFDALVACSGHYNLPRVPNIDGLGEWKRFVGDRVLHTKEYRSPSRFKGKNVLVIGGGVSSLDICRALSSVSAGVIQSTRGGRFDHPTTVLPLGVRRVGEAVKFALHDTTPSDLDPSSPVPGKVILKDGEVLDKIDFVIIATGYVTSYPFLSELHEDETPPEQAKPETLVTSDGNMVHNLHKDIFYIADPSLAFVGIPYYVATFSLFDFQAQAVSRVFTGKTLLPSKEEMVYEYDKRINDYGRGRSFHSLAAENAEIGYVADLVHWVNSSATNLSSEPMQGHTEEWMKAHREYKEMKKLMRQGLIPA